MRQRISNTSYKQRTSFLFKRINTSISSSNLYTATSKETMLASFPTRIQQLTGDSTFCGLVAIFRHLVVCAQIQYTDYCVLNWLFLITPQELWSRYHVTAAYPMAPVYPGNVPAYLPNGYPAENTAIHESWQKRMKEWLEDAHINKALIEHFLSLPTTGAPRSLSKHIDRQFKR